MNVNTNLEWQKKIQLIFGVSNSSFSWNMFSQFTQKLFLAVLPRVQPDFSASLENAAPPRNFQISRRLDEEGDLKLHHPHLLEKYIFF